MSGNQSQGSGGGHSVLHSCIAAAIGACGVPLITALWQRFFGVSLAEWKAYALASVLGGLVFLLLWQGTNWLARRPGVRHRWPFRRWPSPWPAGNRIAIYVADLHGDDAHHTARSNIIASIRRELVDAVEVLPVEQLIGSDSDQDRAVAEADSDARALLRARRGDLLIRGRRHSIDQTTRLDLRFVTAESAQDSGQRIGFTPDLYLDERFAPEMGAALAAVAASLARPAFEQGTSVAWRLTLLVER